MNMLCSKNPEDEQTPESSRMLPNGEKPQEGGGLESSPDLIYSVDQVPPWYECILYGFQHYLSMAGSSIAMPIILSSYLCIEEGDPARGLLVSTIMVACGLTTLLQSTFGVRLPIIQGGSFCYVIPLIALMTTNYDPCSSLPLANMTKSEKEEIYQVRMREVQGSIALSALVQIFIGFTGLIGFLMTWITPLTIIPTLALIGFSLTEIVMLQGSGHLGIYFITLLMAIVFSQHMPETIIPVPVYKRGKGFSYCECQPFKTLPLMLSIMIAWILCAILSTYDLIPEGSSARTDKTYGMVSEAPWFTFPYPGQWGKPTVSIAGFMGMVAAVLVSVVESIGDYCVCARVAGTSMPPAHAVNRGIGIEGIGCLLAGLLGTGCGTTSYSDNIGILSITKIGSRRVIQFSAIFMIIFGVMGKVGTFFVTIPEPIVAAMFTVSFSMITAVGISSSQYIDLSSSRNLFILGFSLFFGISFPKWVSANASFLETGVTLLDQTVSVLLQTSMFVGGTIGFILDNTVPGTDEERGLVQWRKHLNIGDGDGSESCSSYNLPFGMNIIKKMSWARYIPFLPTFQGFNRKSVLLKGQC